MMCMVACVDVYYGRLGRGGGQKVRRVESEEGKGREEGRGGN